MFTVETLGQFWKLGSRAKIASVPVLNRAVGTLAHSSSTMSSHVKRPVPMKACRDVKTRIKTLTIKTIARWQVSYNTDYLLR